MIIARGQAEAGPPQETQDGSPARDAPAPFSSMNLDEFLSGTEGTVSRGVCGTCQLRNKATVDRVLASFLARRDQGLTSVPFSVFVDKFLKPEHGYPFEYRALERHARTCLGLKLPR